MVPKNLNDDQKGRRNAVSAKRLERLETEPDFHNRVTTDDESCFFENNLKPRGRVRNGTRHSLQERRIAARAKQGCALRWKFFKVHNGPRFLYSFQPTEV
jgi:hypothetical protein